MLPPPTSLTFSTMNHLLREQKHLFLFYKIFISAYIYFFNTVLKGSLKIKILMQYFSLLFFDVDLLPLPSQQQAQYFVLKMLPNLCQEKKHLLFASEFLQAGQIIPADSSLKLSCNNFSRKK